MLEGLLFFSCTRGPCRRLAACLACEVFLFFLSSLFQKFVLWLFDFAESLRNGEAVFGGGIHSEFTTHAFPGRIPGRFSLPFVVHRLESL